MKFQVNKSLTVHEDSCPHLSEGCICDDKNGILREEFICSLQGSKCPNQGNLLKGIDKKTVRKEGIAICLKVTQINYVSRNQLDCTGNLNFGLMCKNGKTSLGFVNKLFQLIFFLDPFLLLAELAQKFKFFKIAV